MIAAASTATPTGFASRPCTARRRPRPCCGPVPVDTAPRTPPRRLAWGLQDFLGDGLPAPGPALAADAARGFAAGNGFHTGGIVDRFI